MGQAGQRATPGPRHRWGRVCELTFHHLVIHSLLAGEDEVEQVLAVLEPFWPGLDSLISVQHVQNAVLRVAGHRVKEL